MIIFPATDIKDGKVVTSGGRVAGVTATAPTLEAAIEKAYKATEGFNFHEKYMRKDIGKKALDILAGK